MNKHPSVQQENTDLAHLRPAYNDEIDLGELLRKLISEWKVIAIVTLIGAVLSIAYALTLTPIYKVETIVSEPTVAQLGNTTEQNLVGISPRAAFQDTINQTSTAMVQRAAFIASDLNKRLASEDETGDYDPIRAFSRLRNNLKIEKLVYDYNELAEDQVAPLTDIRISLETAYAAEAVDLLNKLIDLADEQALENFSNDVTKSQDEKIKELNLQLSSLTESAIESREAKIQRMVEANELQIAKIQQKMSTLQENAREDRQNRIIQLTEALATADRLNINEPVTWDDLRPNQRTSQITNELGETTKSSPLYFQGTRILSAEIERLQNRKDDRPFIGEYNQLAQQIEDLKNDPEIEALRNREDDTIYIETFDDLKRNIALTQSQPTVFSGAQFSQITLEPTVPAEPIKPNRKLIVVAATVLAGFAGLFIALIRIAIRKEPA